MIDIKLLREDLELVKRSVANRGGTFDFESLGALEKRRRELLAAVEKDKATRNRVTGEIAELKKSGADAQKLITEMRVLSDHIKECDVEIGAVEDKLREMMLELPNTPAGSVPLGEDEQDNVEVRRCGEKPYFDFEPKAHWDIAPALGIIDWERAAKIAKTRFSLYFGAGAKLERALINFMLDSQSERGYTEVFPPIMVNRDSLTGTGQLPKFEEELFKARDDNLYMIPTAEVPVTNIYRDEILDGSLLPLKYCAYTPCFRREAGAYGKETRGLIRQHQFNKVELVKFATPEQSFDELEGMLTDASRILELLGIHYRVIELCTGDLGFAAAKTYDIEVWLPGFGDFKEISSCSNTTDFQARRANIRFRPDGKGKAQFAHTLNGSGLAVGRTVAAVLENYQQQDGSVVVPEKLRPYMGGLEVIESR
ncbi:MAG: serine--tRNA ligase [Actinobacteria bacterium]|nr:MAG: serine--tRNA ligase [Actinomycetota bacterium]